jgi:uncharacterized cupin superfamily protein
MAKDEHGHGSERRATQVANGDLLAAHQAGIEALSRHVKNASDEELVSISQAQRAAVDRITKQRQSEYGEK